MSVPALPDGIVIRGATQADAAPLEPVIRMADPDNLDGSWRQLPSAIGQSLDPEKLAHVRVVEESASGALVGGMLALPAAWAFTHPMLMGSPNVHTIAGLIASLGSLAVVDEWRGKGIARPGRRSGEGDGLASGGKAGRGRPVRHARAGADGLLRRARLHALPRRHRHPHASRFHLPRPDQGLPLLGEAPAHRRPDAGHAHPYGRLLVIHGILPLPAS
ncbi:hypothetical protein [Streptomyces sp. NPDC059970]|uniref:hypothetical protein n=1 Tax=Streptomyces sp. NPDC059970 TaxID=3347019 RepID=UPI00369DB0FF